MKKMTMAAVVLAATAMVGCGKGSISMGDLKSVDLEKIEEDKELEEMGLSTGKIDSLSYIMGLTQTNGLKDYLAQVYKMDTTNLDKFYEGMLDYFNSKGNKSEVAYNAGLLIASQIDMNMLRSQDYQLVGNDSTEVISRKHFLAAFFNKLKGEKAATDLTDQDAMFTARRLNEELRQAVNQKWQKKNEDWMAEVAKKDGVKKLSDNLYYEVITEGTGEVPTDSSKVKVNYEGKLMDGNVFDSGYERGEAAEFAANQVIPGWTEALTHMPVGSKWKLYIGQEKGYGERQAGSIRPYSALEFTVELLDIVKE